MVYVEVATPPTPPKHRIHPAADLFPMLPEAELRELADDIRANGQTTGIVAVMTPEGPTIVDGRNRLRACEIAGVEPMIVIHECDDPIALALSLNLKRRHLTESQRAMVAAAVANLRHGTNQHGAKEDGSIEPSTGKPPSESKTIADAAQDLKVGRESVKRARVVRDKGAPELVEAVQSGTVAVSAAATLTKLPVEEQREILARGPEAVREKARDLRAPAYVGDEYVEDEDAGPGTPDMHEYPWDEGTALADATRTLLGVIRAWPEGHPYAPLWEVFESITANLRAMK